MQAGAFEGLIRTEEEWERWLSEYPGARYENQADLKPPFYVISRVVFGGSSEPGEPKSFMHHLVGQDTARALLQAPRERFFDSSGLWNVVFEKLPRFDDARGHLVQLFRKDELSRLPQYGGPRVDFPPMAYLSVTATGVSRGPHEHLTQTDIFIFCCSQFEIFLWDNRPKSPTHRSRHRLYTTKEDYWRLLVPPGVVHAYRALDNAGTVINCPDKLYAGWDQEQPVDEIRHERDPSSPFQLWT